MTMSVSGDEDGHRTVVVATAERSKPSEGQNIFLPSGGNTIMNRELTFSFVSKTVTCCTSVFATTGHTRWLLARAIRQVRKADR